MKTRPFLSTADEIARLNAMRSSDVIECLQRQLIEPDLALQDYLATARRFGHGINIVLFVRPDGNLGLPKVNIDTRKD